MEAATGYAFCTTVSHGVRHLGARGWGVYSVDRAGCWAGAGTEWDAAGLWSPFCQGSVTGFAYSAFSFSSFPLLQHLYVAPTRELRVQTNQWMWVDVDLLRQHYGWLVLTHHNLNRSWVSQYFPSARCISLSCGSLGQGARTNEQRAVEV